MIEEFARRCAEAESMNEYRQILSELVEVVKEDCVQSCIKTSLNWSANNDDYKAVALTCAEDIKKIRYLIKN